MRAVRPAWILNLALCVTACASDAANKPRPPDPNDAGLSCTSCGACEETLTVTSALHVTGPIAYDDHPPVGGPHHSCWGSWGVHDETLEPERWVHNLEHGGIVLLDNCATGCPDELMQLQAFVNSHPRTLLTAYTDMPTRFAAVSWGHRLLSDCLDLDAFEHFYAAHFNRGLEAIDGDPPVECGLSPDL
jgi:Protein of unknown function (DUF3105)